MTRRSASRPSKPKKINYRQKLAYIRKFERVGRKAAANKSYLTRKYKELHRLRGLKFVAADKKTIRKLTAKEPHTKKGFFVPKEKGMKIRVNARGIVVSVGGVRTEYFFPLTDIEAAAFLGDPKAFAATLVEREELQKKHPGQRFYVRIVYRTGQSTNDMKPNDLILSLLAVKDTIEPRSGNVRKSVAQKLKKFGDSIVGIKMIFAGQTSRGEGWQE